MPCCCVKTLNLCRVPVCGELEFDKAAVVGSGDDMDYTLVLDFLNTTVTLTQEQTDGENIKFDVSMLNENFEYTGQLFNTDLNPVSIDVGEETYDCIKFKTVVNVTA